MTIPELAVTNVRIGSPVIDRAFAPDMAVDDDFCGRTEAVHLLQHLVNK